MVTTLSLTCACGARLEVDPRFAGQTIRCPDCARPLLTPPLVRPPLRTSGRALASLVLALVGAFTVVGTLLAVVLGLLALVDIRRHREKLAGRGYAVAGVVLGLLLTGISLYAYWQFEFFGLDGLLREPRWAGKLDYNGPLEIVRSKEGFAITRPSEDWGVYNDPQFQNANWVRSEVLLVNVGEDAYLLCWPLPVDNQMSLERCRDRALEEFRDGDLTGPARSKMHVRPAQFEVRRVQALPTVNETEGVEMVVDKSVGGMHRTYLVRVLKKQGDDQMYLLAGGTGARRFGRMEAQLRSGLESVRLLDRVGGINGP